MHVRPLRSLTPSLLPSPNSLTASPTLQIGEACRTELLQFETQFNAQEAPWGVPGIWIWQPLFNTCGLAGGGGQAPPVTTEEPPVEFPPVTVPPVETPGGDGGETVDGGALSICDHASLAAEEVGAWGSWAQEGACAAKS